MSIVGATLVALFIAGGAFGHWLAPHSPYETDYRNTLAAPSAAHPFGTDDFGRDVLSRVICGAGISLGIGLAVSILSTGVGLTIGTISGFVGGALDTLVMRVADLFMAFPPVIVAMVLATILGGSVRSLIIALAVSGWTGTARLARGEALSIRSQGFIRAARVVGCRPGHILWHHVLPNVIPPVLVSATLSFGRIVLSTAGLSFIGVGVQAPLPEWGRMISEGREFIVSGQWWLVFFPGLAIVTVVMGLNFLGDGLRDILDPRQRR
jgi:peptide/nickel transport system permease protein